MKWGGFPEEEEEEEEEKRILCYLGFIIVRSCSEMRWTMSAGSGRCVTLSILIGKHGFGVRGIRIGPFGTLVTVVTFQPPTTCRRRVDGCRNYRFVVEKRPSRWKSESGWIRTEIRSQQRSTGSKERSQRRFWSRCDAQRIHFRS